MSWLRQVLEIPMLFSKIVFRFLSAKLVRGYLSRHTGDIKVEDISDSKFIAVLSCGSCRMNSTKLAVPLKAHLISKTFTKQGKTCVQSLHHE